MEPMGNPLQCQLWPTKDPITKLMWNHTRGISPWFLPRKSAGQRTSVPREWSNSTECSDCLQFQPRKRKFSKGEEATAETILNKKMELKVQRLECCWLECSGIAASKAAAEEGGFSQSNGQAVTEKRSSQNYVSKKKLAEELAHGMDVRNLAATL